MKKLTNREILKLEIEAENITAALADVKRLYERLDEIALILRGHKLSKFKVVDNFADSNVCFRTHGIKRFELKPIIEKKKAVSKPNEFFKVRSSK